MDWERALVPVQELALVLVQEPEQVLEPVLEQAQAQARSKHFQPARRSLREMRSWKSQVYL